MSLGQKQSNVIPNEKSLGILSFVHTAITIASHADALLAHYEIFPPHWTSAETTGY